MKRKEYEKNIWRKGRIAIVYIVVMAIFLSALGTVHAASASIVLDPKSGAPGTEVWVNGTGFTSTTAPGGSTVDIYWDSTSSRNRIGSTTQDSNGDISTQVSIPLASEGIHTIYAKDANGDVASASFMVVPKITLSASSGYVGDYVTVTGVGFPQYAYVSIYWDSTNLSASSYSPRANGTGTFSYTFRVSKSPYGLHTVSAKVWSNSQEVSSSFFVKDRLWLSESYGVQWTLVGFKCTGYSANVDISVIMDMGEDTEVALASGRTDATGTFSGSFRIPSVPYGYHTVTAVDSDSVAYSTYLFVEPRLSVSPGTGTVGTEVWISGYGFSQGVSVEIKWDGTVINSTYTDMYGFFGMSITVPNSTAGNHQITATDTNSISASSAFSVVPRIVMSPDTGIAGTSSTITGTGFAGSSSVTVYWDYGLPDRRTYSVSAAANGSWQFTLAIPSGSNGTHPVVAVDGDGNQAKTSFYLGPHLFLSSSSGFVGDELELRGTTFSPNENVTVYWDTMPVARAQTDGNGTFSTSIMVPHVVYGEHTIMAMDDSGLKSTAVFYTHARITVSESYVHPFAEVYVNGTGFSMLSAVYLYWDGTGTGYSATTTISGDFSLKYMIPPSVIGGHSMVVKDTEGVSSAPLSVYVQPVIELSRASQYVGAGFTVYCAGFAASSNLNLIWDYDTLPYHVTTDSRGSGVIYALVPESSAGTHYLQVYDSSLDYSNRVQFLVLPPSQPDGMDPGTYVNTTSPELEWSPAEYASSYMLEYSTSANFTNSTVVENITGTSYMLSGLADGTTYYWRVRGVDSAGNLGNYSETRVFTVDLTPPDSRAWIKGIYSSEEHIAVYYNASDSVSGVKLVKLFYSYNGGDYIFYAESHSANGVFDFYAVHGDGIYRFYTVAVDRAGNYQAAGTMQAYVVVDTSPPVSEMAPLPAYSTSRSIELSFNAQDNGTGVRYVNVYWSNDGTTWNYLGEFNSSVQFTVPHDGRYYFRTQAVDMAGNVQDGYGEASTVVDTVPPEVSAVLNGTVGSDGWYTSPVTVGFSASDLTSGVAGIYYRINGGALMTYTAPFTLSRDGIYNITYYAKDRAGNAAPVAGTVIKIDRTTPSLSIASPEPDSVLTGNYTVVAVSSDDNINGVYLRVDNGPWYSFTGKGKFWSISVDTAQYSDGEHILTVKSVDVAGNTAVKSVEVRFDNNHPDVKEIEMPSGAVSGTVKIVISAEDSVGIKEAKCILSSTRANHTMYMSKNAQGEYYLNINTTDIADGRYTLTVYIENYGGKVTESSTTLIVDNTAPTARYTGLGVLEGKKALTFSVSDSVSGIKGAWISIDGGPWLPVKVEDGKVSYCWNTVLAGNGVHTISLKVEDNAGNVGVYQEQVSVNNLNYVPVAYTVIVAALVISLLMLFRKKEKKTTAEEKKEDDMSLPVPEPEIESAVNGSEKNAEEKDTGTGGEKND